MRLTCKIRLAILLMVLAGAVGCDQTSKHMARSKLTGKGSISLPGGFGELRLAENPGSFLSLGDSLPERARRSVFTLGVGGGLVALLIFLSVENGLGRLSFAGLALAWAGGTSNWIDRFTRHGNVSDFIFLRIGPIHTGIFNIADVIIMAGVMLLVGSLWRRRRGKAGGRG